MLYYNNPTISSLKSFYYKRFKSIFPMFYIAFFIMYMIKAIYTHDFLYGGNPVKLLLTLFGLDGYFLYLIPNYYLIGEWFLGAIVLLYAIYPVLLKAFNKSVRITTLLAFGLYATVFIPDLYKIDARCNLFSCLISFVLGMVLMKYRSIWHKKAVVFLVSLFVSVVIIFVKIDFIHENICNHLLAFSLFFVLSYIGELIMKNKVCLKVFGELSGLSYAIFLIQHIVINFALKFYMPTNDLLAVCLLLAIIAITIVFAKLLTLVNNKLLKSPIIKKLDTVFL